MPTLRIFEKPHGFELPSDYKTIRNSSDNISFVKKIDSEVEGYDKYTIGRYFQKPVLISKPSETDIETISENRPTSLICQVYISKNKEENIIFIVGSDSDSLNQELIKFSNAIRINHENIDIRALEKKSFASGVINLMGHKYNAANDTINYTVRKIDGIPFRDDDPDFVSCDIIQKEALVVMLTNLPRTPTFYVYTDGKITRKGVAESDTTEFELLKIVYDIIKQETSQ